jgi:ubiquinone/menaquinone biosynthesis C-methylase UbiE
MSLLRRLAFHLWYFFNPPWDTGISPPELLEFIQGHPPRRAIDLGCGTGTNVITLARAGWQVTGIDFAGRAIRLAKRKSRELGLQVDLRVGDVTALKNLPGPFDLALDIGCFHSVDDRASYLDQLTRLLTPGGEWLMYGFFNPDPHLAGPGLAQPDLDLIATRGLTQIWRRDGSDRNDRPSAWFLFRRN